VKQAGEIERLDLDEATQSESSPAPRTGIIEKAKDLAKTVVTLSDEAKRELGDKVEDERRLLQNSMEGTPIESATEINDAGPEVQYRKGQASQLHPAAIYPTSFQTLLLTQQGTMQLRNPTICANWRALQPQPKVHQLVSNRKPSLLFFPFCSNQDKVEFARACFNEWSPRHNDEKFKYRVSRYESIKRSILSIPKRRT
jgi:hypothetical protein